MNLEVCLGCRRHVREGETCPFCASPRRAARSLVAVAATLAGCSGSSPAPRDAPAYGVPPEPTPMPAPDVEDPADATNDDVPPPAPSPTVPEPDPGAMRALYGAPPPEGDERPE